jgi:hypothetical protein
MAATDFSGFALIVNLLFWAALVTLCLGLCMLAAPQRILRLGQVLNRWVSTDYFFRRLDTPHYGERFFYRYHVLFGSFIILGSSYIFYRFMYDFKPDSFVLPLFTSNTANQWLTTSLVFMNILFSILVFLFGLIIVLRPSLLKRLEAVLNRWFVTEESIRKLDLQLPTPDSVFGRRPRMMGIIIVAGSLYILMNLWSML